MGGFKLCYKLKEDLPKARCKKMNEVDVCIAWEIGTEKQIYMVYYVNHEIWSKMLNINKHFQF